MNRSSFALLLVLLFAGTPGWARTQDPVTPSVDALGRADAFFGDGVQLYRRGEYGPAQERFKAALATGADALEPGQRVRILRALGNTAYRRGNALEAVGWYTAALDLAPRDPDLWVDAELARSDAGLPPLARGTIASDVDRYLHARTPAAARRLAFGGGLILCSALLLELLRGGRAARWLAIAAFLAAAWMSLPWLATFLPEPDDPHLVLRTSPLAVRSEPQSGLAAIAHLDPGTTVSRLDELEDWIRIKGSAQEGQIVGWVPAGALFALER